MTSATRSEGQNYITDSHAQKKGLKLPKIEVRKLSGHVKVCLASWSQFRYICNGPNMEKEKFKHLIQATTEGNRLMA